MLREEPDCYRAVEIKSSERIERKDPGGLKRLRALEWNKPLRLYAVYRGMEYAGLDGIGVLPVYGLRQSR